MHCNRGKKQEMVIKCITEEFRNNVSKTKNQRTDKDSTKEMWVNVYERVWK